MQTIIAVISGVICGACCGVAIRAWLKHQETEDSLYQDKIKTTFNNIEIELDNLDTLEKEETHYFIH